MGQKSALRPFTLLLVAFLSSGCALSYEDSDGKRHVLGVATVEVRRTAGDTPSLTGDVLVIKSMGLSLHQSGSQTSINLGHITETSAILHPCIADEATTNDTCHKSSRSFLDKPRQSNGAPIDAPTSLQKRKYAVRTWSGFLNFAYQPPHIENAGDVTAVKTVGLSLLQIQSEQSVSVGYSDHTFVTPTNNVVVMGNPIDDLKIAHLHPSQRNLSSGNIK